jgi:hypothetical protein
MVCCYNPHTHSVSLYRSDHANFALPQEVWDYYNTVAQVGNIWLSLLLLCFQWGTTRGYVLARGPNSWANKPCILVIGKSLQHWWSLNTGNIRRLTSSRIFFKNNTGCRNIKINDMSGCVLIKPLIFDENRVCLYIIEPTNSRPHLLFKNLSYTIRLGCLRQLETVQ